MTDAVQQKGEVKTMFEFVNRGLDDLRRRVDEMLVRLDVGEMNVRGEVQSDFDRAVNMALLVKSRLNRLVGDLASKFGVDQPDEHVHRAETVATDGQEGNSRGRHARTEHVRG